MENSEKEKTITKVNEELTPKDNIDKDIKINELINSVFKNKCNKTEIIEKLRPFFTLKVIPQREIDKVYSAIEKIDPEKIDLIEEFKYEEEKYDSRNIFETKSKSVGLSDFDLDLSLSIFGNKQSIKYDDKEEKNNFNSKLNTKIHSIHSIVVSLFRIIIDFKEIKLAKTFEPKLKSYTIATTVKRNDKLTDYVLMESFKNDFEINIDFWQDIDFELKMSSNSDILKDYFPEVYRDEVHILNILKDANFHLLNENYVD